MLHRNFLFKTSEENIIFFTQLQLSTLRAVTPIIYWQIAKWASTWPKLEETDVAYLLQLYAAE